MGHTAIDAAILAIIITVVAPFFKIPQSIINYHHAGDDSSCEADKQEDEQVSSAVVSRHFNIT